MTHNQLTYQQNIEMARHNVAGERETYRSNVAREAETHRSNVAREAETYRSNVVNEQELQRHNRASEGINRHLANTQRMNARTQRLSMYNQQQRWQAQTLNEQRMTNIQSQLAKSQIRQQYENVYTQRSQQRLNAAQSSAVLSQADTAALRARNEYGVQTRGLSETSRHNMASETINRMNAVTARENQISQRDLNTQYIRESQVRTSLAPLNTLVNALGAFARLVPVL